MDNILEAEPEEEFEMDMEIKRRDMGASAPLSPISHCEPCSQSNDNKVSHPQFVNNFQSGHPSKNIPQSDPALIQAAFTNFVNSIYGNKSSIQQPPQHQQPSSSSQPRSQQQSPQSPYQQQQSYHVPVPRSHFPPAPLQYRKPMTPPQSRPQQVQYYTADLTNTLLNISERELTNERSMGQNEVMTERPIADNTNPQPRPLPVRPLPFNGSNNHGHHHGNYIISHSIPQQPAPRLPVSTTTDHAAPGHSSSTTTVNQQSYIPVYTPPPNNTYASQFQHSQLTASSPSQSPGPHLQRPFFIYTQPPPQQPKQVPHSGMPVGSRPNPTQPPKNSNQNIPIQHSNNNNNNINNNNNFHLNNSMGIPYNPAPQQNRPIQLSHPHHAIPIQQQQQYNNNHDHYHPSQNSPIQHQPITPFGTPVPQLQQKQQPHLYAHNAHRPTQCMPGPPPLPSSYLINKQQQQSQAPPPTNSPTLSTSTSQNQPSMTQNSHQ